MMWISIALIAICIPLVGILTSAWLKGKEIDARKYQYQGKELGQELRALQEENDQLKERLTNLETIVASKDWDLFLPEAKMAEKDAEKLKTLAGKIKESSSQDLL